jgi:hypothetical protein
MILDHPLGERLDVGIFAILLSSTSAMPPVAASFTKVLSSWLSASLAGAAALWLG